MKLYEIKTLLDTASPSELGVSTVYRTEQPNEYFRGKSIWGVGRYFSLSRAESEKINSGGNIEEFVLPDSLKLADFDLTWRVHPEKSDADYEHLGELIKSAPPLGVDGYVVRSNSLQYGFSQVVIFPHAVNKIQKA